MSGSKPQAIPVTPKSNYSGPVVVDPVTRIEGHLRIDTVVENGKMSISGAMDLRTLRATVLISASFMACSYKAPLKAWCSRDCFNASRASSLRW